MTLLEQINALKKANQQLDMENLKLKYLLFASCFVNLFMGLYLIYESLH
jgi:hypothetical protein